MPHYTIGSLTDLAFRALARCRRQPRDGARRPRARWWPPMRRGSPRTACRACRSTRRISRNGRADGGAVPAVVRAKGGAVLVDAALRPRVSGLRARGGRGDRARARARRRLRRRHQQPSLRRRRRITCRRWARRAWSASRSAIRRRRCRRPADARRSSAPIRSPRSFRAGRGAPLSIDLSLSEVARGKLMVAAKEGKPIPLGWALDRDGNPTTDPKAGLEGSMLPMGGDQGRDAGAGGRAARDRAHRRRDRRRGELVLRRRGQPAAHRPGVPRDRSGGARRAATSISSAWKR